MSIKDLQNYTYISKYAKFNEEKQRRETWDEAIDRVMDMHLRRYPQISEEIIWSFDQVREYNVLGSQRALQFGGPGIEKKHGRLFNCTVSFCDRLRFFQEALWFLLCGSGVGFSIQKHHVAKLPKFSKRTHLSHKLHVIEDSIEGWADALGVLLSSYFEDPIFPYYQNSEVSFDYSKIRKAGSKLASSSGKAPGPEPLRKALELIRNLLERCIPYGKLRPIDAYDIVMHSSDAVLSGGVRRSACLALFSADDEEMANAKTGNWFYDNPQRARANNSALLLRNHTSWEDFNRLIIKVKEHGEPGFVWSDSTEFCINPCFHPDTRLATENGLIKIIDLYNENNENKVIIDNRAGKGSEINLSNYGTSTKDATKVFLTQKQAKIYEITTLHGHKLNVTETHEFPTPNGRIMLKNLKIGDTLLLQSSEGKFGKIGNYNQGLTVGLISKSDNVGFKEIYDRLDIENAPNSIWEGNKDFIIGYLHGIFHENYKFDKNLGIILKNFPEIQLLLQNFGIVSNILNENLYINNSNLVKFMRYVGVLGKNKDIINEYLETTKFPPESYTTTIISIKENGISDVYCLTQPETNTVIANGIVTGQCCEIGFCPISYKGESGWNVCNLSEINGAKVLSPSDFRKAARAASIIGTIQSGYSDFPYLGPITESIVRREALIGVSITGMMENPDIIFDPKLQREVAELIKLVNSEIAKKIGINPAARCTCVKPSGTASCLLGTSSGIHPNHSRRYFRRVQANVLEEPFKFFAERNPLAVENSCWSANKTDGVITFCIDIKENSKTKNEINAVKLLEYVKNTQINWVLPGTRYENNPFPWVNHNVSNTINVNDNEWEDVAKYIYDNREYFCGVALLPSTGDKDYPQAPFCSVLTPKEIVEKYGDGSIMASGLIVDALKVFSDLWVACSSILGYGEGFNQCHEKSDWVRRAIQFAERYFNGDIKTMTYCLKDVHCWKLWCDLKREWQHVDYTQMTETEDNTKFHQEVACSGGKCELI